jgi:homogentisate phytyltransferase / homogentisate geranylgeranyltransferase
LADYLTTDSKQKVSIKTARQINLQKIYHLVEKVEAAKISLSLFIVTLGSLIFARIILEHYVVGPLEQAPSLIFINNSLTFFLSAFLAATLLLSLISKQRIEKVSKVMLVGYVYILLPPLIDAALGNGANYTSVPDLNLGLAMPNWGYLLRAYSVFFSGVSGVTLGIQVEISVFVILAAVYVGVKTKSMLKTAATAIVIYSLIFCYIVLPYFVDAPPYFEAFNSSHNCQFLSSIFTVFIAFQLGLWLYFFDKAKLKSLSRSILSTRSFLYVAIAVVGVVLGGGGLYPGLLAVICTLILWQIAVSINQVTDVSEDSISKRDNPVVSAAINQQDMISIALGYCVLAVLFAVSIGYVAIVLTAASLCLSILYSTPPIRLKRYPFVASSVIAIFALIVFSLGFYSGPPTNAFPIGMALAILVCYNLAINTKDLKDYEGDKKSGVLTLPVLLGQRRGRIAIGVLDFVAYCAVPLILKIPLLMVPALIFGGVTFYLIYREETPEKLIFVVFFMFLAVVLGSMLLFS